MGLLDVASIGSTVVTAGAGVAAVVGEVVNRRHVGQVDAALARRALGDLAGNDEGDIQSLAKVVSLLSPGAGKSSSFLSDVVAEDAWDERHLAAAAHRAEYNISFMLARPPVPSSFTLGLAGAAFAF